MVYQVLNLNAEQGNGLTREWQGVLLLCLQSPETANLRISLWTLMQSVQTQQTIELQPSAEPLDRSLQLQNQTFSSSSYDENDDDDDEEDDDDDEDDVDDDEDDNDDDDEDDEDDNDDDEEDDDEDDACRCSSLCPQPIRMWCFNASAMLHLLFGFLLLYPCYYICVISVTLQTTISINTTVQYIILAYA